MLSRPFNVSLFIPSCASLYSFEAFVHLFDVQTKQICLTMAKRSHSTFNVVAVVKMILFGNQRNLTEGKGPVQLTSLY